MSWAWSGVLVLEARSLVLRRYVPCVHAVPCLVAGRPALPCLVKMLGEILNPAIILRGQESFRELYRQGELDDRRVTVDLPGSRVNVTNMEGPGGQALQEMISRLDRCLPVFLTVCKELLINSLSNLSACTG